MIILIRHAKVKFDWKSKYTSQEFASANQEYDCSDIFKIDSKKIQHIKEQMPDDFTLYTSSLRRSIETALQLFPDNSSKQIKELSEIPIEPYKETSKKLSLWKWFFFGRMQWFFNNPIQKRSKTIVNQEIEEFVSKLEQNRNTVIIGHGFQMRLMINSLNKKRYKIIIPKRIDNLDLIKCIKRGPTTAST
jgi:broad specificity phosphatase PhoE